MRTGRRTIILTYMFILFAEYDAVVRIPDGELMEHDDGFPEAKIRLAQVWVDLHTAELMENWRLIGSDKKFFKISPLEVK